MTTRARFLALLAAIWMSGVSGNALEKSMPLFSCAADNDLYRVLADNGLTCPRHDTPLAAVEAAPDGAGVLLLADGYPARTQQIAPQVFEIAARKKLRLYVEYPATLPQLEVGQPRDTTWERGVIVSDAFGPELKPMRILGIHDCHFVPVAAEHPHMVVAKVAGFDTAVYGLPAKDVWPILFEHPGAKTLVATTKLSQFVTARYAPTDAWAPVWRMILGWVQPGLALPQLKWTPVVRPSYGAQEPLPADAEREAIRRGNEWVIKARMLIHPSWRGRDWGPEAQGKRYSPERATAAKADDRFKLPAGDGSAGILEGYKSKIHYDGSQTVRWCLRTDCTGEEVAAFVLGGKLLNDANHVKIGRNLADFVLFKFDATAPWRNPAHPAFGLIGWCCSPTLAEPTDQHQAFYGAINARICMSIMAAATLLGDDRWDDRVLQAILANFRTTGLYGLRESAPSPKMLEQKGWQHFFNEPRLNLSCHPTAQLLAANLVAYKATGYRPLLERTRTGLRLLMEAYPDKLKWWNGLQQERARLILPLAWLVRIENTPEHREWLRRIVGDFLKSQAACGAVAEELGAPGKEHFRAKPSNESYGTTETPLIQANGDPVCDLLYTLNSGFIGLHEAAAATGDAEWRKAEDRLAEFFCRIQTRSDRRPELDGTWFRAFDFGRWDYWASNADAGWGAWSVETGWVQGWLVTTFALRQMNTTLWDLTSKRPLAVHLEKNLKQLLPESGSERK
ncbi:MAG: hypothetical protein HZA88_21330 [Verrucomicrobia bacterium]|nr:hypothetical protein [Verrucomicrobiota bacterium]